jgi:hypothetical protein
MVAKGKNNGNSMINKFKQLLDHEFVTTSQVAEDNGDCHLKYLAFDISKVGKQIIISQSTKIDNLVRNCNMVDYPSVKSPYLGKGLPPSPPRTIDTKLTDDQRGFSVVVGAINHLTMTQFGVLHAVRELGKFNQNPTEQHIQAVHHVVKFMRDHKWGIQLPPLEYIRIFSDASLNGATARLGTLVMINDKAITAESKEPKRKVTSIAEAEILATVNAVKKAMVYSRWLKALKSELGDKPIPIFIDNKSAVAMANADGTRNASRYFSDLLEFLRQQRDQGIVSFHHVSAKDQKADFLTKRVSGKALQAALDDIQTRV